MATFVLIGKSKGIAWPVLQAINGFANQKCILVGDKETSPMRWSSLCKEHLLIDFDEKDDTYFVNLVNGINGTKDNESNKINKEEVILIPYDCQGIRLVNQTRNFLKHSIIPIPDVQMMNLFEDKWSFYEFCTNNFLSVPYTRFIGSKSNLNFSAIVSEMGLPFVIKPVMGSNSFSVRIVHNKSQFEDDIQNNPCYDYGALIAQRYIEGVDVGLNLLSVHGKVNAVAMQRLVFSEMHFISNDYLKLAAEKISGVSSYHGVMNVKARIEKGTGKVFLIESNPCFWATLITSAECGLNFMHEVIHLTSPIAPMRQLTSGSADVRHPLVRPASWRSLVFDRSQRGRLLRVRLFDLYSLGELIEVLLGNALAFIKRQSAFILKILRIQHMHSQFEVDLNVANSGSVTAKRVAPKARS